MFGLFHINSYEADAVKGRRVFRYADLLEISGISRPLGGLRDAIKPPNRSHESCELSADEWCSCINAEFERAIEVVSTIARR
jgi:hypothetical protein